jgi:hypothetical protein
MQATDVIAPNAPQDQVARLSEDVFDTFYPTVGQTPGVSLNGRKITNLDSAFFAQWNAQRWGETPGVFERPSRVVDGMAKQAFGK